jgi:hypothetical protein
MVSELFAEMFERFKDDVNVKNIKTLEQLELALTSWYEGHGRWKGTSKQNDALADEASKLGIETEDYYRREQKKWDRQHQWDEAVYNAPQERFSTEYGSYQQWQTQTVRTTAYQRRISNYTRSHPNTTLAEARGHAKKTASKAVKQRR